MPGGAKWGSMDGIGGWVVPGRVGMDSNELKTIFEFEGAYGGRQSRDQVMRALREALAILEITHAQDILCPPFRIQANVEEE